MSENLTRLKARLADVNALHAAVAIMDWDQQTFMPEGGAEARAQHVSQLSRLAHELLTADEVGTWLERSAGEVAPGSDDAALARVVKRDFDLATKIPSALVAKKSKLAAEGHEIWVRARANNDFVSFAPFLEQLLDIVREEANHLGYEHEPYDALLDQYEEGATADDCRRMFATLKENTVGLVRDITTHGVAVDDHLLCGEWDIARQKRLTEMMVKDIGFDFTRGRQDTAPHPFCTGWSIGDIRLTTRFQDHVCSSIFSSLHEAGHGMYEQGSPKAWDLTPLAGGVSLGIHESQSRLWENIVGRSKPFWKRYLHELHAEFPSLAAIYLDEFYRLVNKVQPSLIRVEADEVTYNLHVMVRFELECDMLNGTLAVKDLPAAWNAKYKEYLGVDVPSDSKGCLQDVHWSMGSIGYFPTYSMGNLLSYQIWNTLQQDIPNTDELIEKGEFGPILRWLQEHVYSQGRKYAPKELVMRVTGKPMQADDYVEALNKKYRDIYRI